MAEILIQRRRHRNVWPWLLALLALALLPLPFMAADRDDRRPTRGAAVRGDTTPRRDTAARPTAVAQPTAPPGGGNRTTATVGGSVTPPAAAAAAPAAPATTFERFIASARPNANEREHVSFTAEGLRRLADELRRLGASESSVRSIVANADSLERINPRRTGHADYARAAFLTAVREFDVLHRRRAARVDTAQLRAAAWAIRREPTLHAQRGAVQTFFQSARDAIAALSRSTGARRRR